MRGLACLRRFFSSHPTAVAGVASIELAIIAPVVVLAFICTVDLGLGINRSMQVETAAQAGAEYVLTHGFSVNGITTAVASATSFASIQATPTPTQFCGCASSGGVINSQCGVPCANGTNPGAYVIVSTQASYDTLLPYPTFPNTFVFSARSTVRIH